MLRKLTNTLIFCFVISISFAQDYYWVGGSGNWSDITHWATTSGGTTIHAVVPGPNDNVIFDANSGFTTGNNTVTIDVTANCHDMTWVGAQATPVITGGATNPLNVYGSWTLQANMSYRVRKTNFRSSSLGETLTTNGTIINLSGTNSGVEFDGTGSWTFMDDYEDSGNLGLMVLIQGTLITNGNNLNINGFQSQGSGVRHLDLGSSEITIRTSGSYSWYYQGSNHTIDAGTSHIKLVEALNSTGVNTGFRGALNHAYHHVTYSNPLSTVGRFSGPVFVEKLTFMGNATIVSSSNTIDTLILSAGKKYAFGGGQTQTIGSYLSANSPLCSGLIEMVSATAGSATLQFSPGSVANINNTLIENIAATGNVPVTANNSFDLGGNTNFIFPPATGQTLYWVGGSGDWNDASHWSLVNDGVYPAVGGCVPTPIDDVVFNNNSGFTTGNNIVTLDGVGHYCHDMTWVGAQATPIIIGTANNPLNVYGSMTLQNDMEYRVVITNFLSNDLGEEITTNGAIVGYSTSINQGIYFNGDGSWSFMDDFTTLSRVHHFKGTLITNSHTISMNRFSSSTTGQRHIDLGSSEVIATSAGWSYSGSNHTIDAGTSHLRFLGGSASFTGNLNHMYHHITFENSSGTNNSLRGPVEVQKLTFLGNGSITSSSNTIDTLVLSAGKNYAFQSGQTQTVNERLYASGNPCFILFMSSTTSGSPAFLNVLGGSLDFNYTNVRDIDASGSYGTLEMGPQSTDAGNNININFAPYDPDAEIEGFGDHLDLPCPLTPFTIYTDGFYPNPSTEFLWGDGSTADTLHITSFGTYTITVNYGEGCVVQDTLHVRPFDITPPVITGCPTDITQSNDSGICGAEVTWTEPIATDECMLDSLVSNFSPGDIFPIGTTTVTYTAYDANLNTATCSFDVTVNDTEAPVIVDCPTDITVNNDLGSCDAVVTWTAPTFTDNCTGTTLTSTHNSGDTFPFGTTTVTYTATDAAGNVQTCSFEVTVNDNEAPVFTACPSDIAQDVDAGSCDAVVTWTAPTFTDNCTGTTLTSTHNSGDTFPIGTTTVTYTATDAAGNVQTCSFDVVITDNEDPVFVDFPSDTIVVCYGEVVDLSGIVVEDNCSGVTLTSTHEPGDVFPIGTTTVTYTATDASGNQTDTSLVVV